MKNKEQNYIGYKQVAELMGLPIGTVYSMVSRKQIPHLRLGKRIVRFDQAAIMAWVNGNSIPVVRRNAGVKK